MKILSTKYYSIPETVITGIGATPKVGPLNIHLEDYGGGSFAVRYDHIDDVNFFGGFGFRVQVCDEKTFLDSGATKIHESIIRTIWDFISDPANLPRKVEQPNP